MIRKINFKPFNIGMSKGALKKTAATATIAVAGLAIPINTSKYSDREFDAHKAYCLIDVPKYQNWDNKTAAKYRKIIQTIIKDDKNAPKDKNFDEIIDFIMKISDEYDVNPIEIACIIKKETPFKENQNGVHGNGLMQVTEIVAKDMFQRSSIYHEKLTEFIGKYKNHAELYADLKQNNETNIRSGVLAYHERLKETKGDVKKALEKYNASGTKESYARKVFGDVQKYQRLFERI